MPTESETVETTETTTEVETTPVEPTPKTIPRETRTRQPSVQELQDQLDERNAQLRAREDQVKKLNAESAGRRLKLEEFERQKEEAETAKLGEMERLKKERESLAAKVKESEAKEQAARENLNRARLKFEVQWAAQKHGFEDPELVLPALESLDLAKFEFTEDGKPVGIKDALDRLAKQKPNMLAAGPRGGTPPSGHAAPKRQGRPAPRSETDPHRQEAARSGRYAF